MISSFLQWKNKKTLSKHIMEKIMPADYKLKLTAKTIEDAAPKARTGLQQAQEKLGFIPNM